MLSTPQHPQSDNYKKAVLLRLPHPSEVERLKKNESLQDQHTNFYGFHFPEDLNLDVPSVTNKWPFQDHLLSKTIIWIQRALSPERPEQFMCRVEFPQCQ